MNYLSRFQFTCYAKGSCIKKMKFRLFRSPIGYEFLNLSLKELCPKGTTKSCLERLLNLKREENKNGTGQDKKTSERGR